MAKKYLKNASGTVRAVTSDNLQLEKPLLNENYDIEVHNRNMDKIDNAIQEVKGKIDGLELVAERVSIADPTNKFEATNVEDALLENKTSIHLANENISALQEELGTNKSTLKQILINKKIEGLENENRLSVLIDKVNLFDNYKPKTWLYNEGDECASLTGGWVGTGTKQSGNFKAVPGKSGPWAYQGFYTTKKINLTGYSKIKFNIRTTVSNSFTGAFLNKVNIDTIQTFRYDPAVAGFGVFANNTTWDLNQNYILIEGDISSINGEYYIAWNVGQACTEAVFTGYCTQIWLEK